MLQSVKAKLEDNRIQLENFEHILEEARCISEDLVVDSRLDEEVNELLQNWKKRQSIIKECSLDSGEDSELDDGYSQILQ